MALPESQFSFEGTIVLNPWDFNPDFLVAFQELQVQLELGITLAKLAALLAACHVDLGNAVDSLQYKQTGAEEFDQLIMAQGFTYHELTTAGIVVGSLALRSL